MRKIKLKHSFYFLFLFSFVLSSCDQASEHVLNEGIVDYEITYPPEAQKDKMLSAMMPNKMSLSFKENKTRSDIAVGLGLMTTVFISDPDSMLLKTLLQILDKKYALILNEEMIKEQIHRKKEFTIQWSDQTKKIAGYKCKKAIATNGTDPEVIIYYTEDLLVKNPNWSGPFHEIPGVMLEYELVLNNIRLKLNALKVNGVPVNSSIFNVPSDYIPTSRQDMPEIFSQFFN